MSKVSGDKEIRENLKKVPDLIGERVELGLKKAGLFLQRESMKLVPVDTGNLKASAFTRATGKGVKTLVTVGYTANYALFVHEMVEMKLRGQPRPGNRGRYWDPQGRAQAKFLEEPYKRLRPEMFRMIKETMKGGKPFK